MDVHFGGFVVFEFLPQTREEELHDALEELYGNEAEEYGGGMLGSSGTWYRHVYGNHEDNQLEANSEFEWIRTIVERKTWGITDIITLAVLSEDQLTRIVEEEGPNSSEYYQCRKSLNELLEDIPSVVEDAPTEKASICYVEPAEKLGIWGEDGLEMERIQAALEEHAVLLNRFNFTNAGYLSLISGNIFVAPEILMQPWDRLVAISRGLDIEDPTPEELVLGPNWYTELSSFQTYFRTFFWCEFRSGEIRKLDVEIDDNRDSLVSETSNDLDMDAIFDLAQSNRDVSTRWVGLHSWLIDELDGLRKNFRTRADEAEDPLTGPYDIAIPSTEGGGLVFEEDENNSLISLYEDQARDYLDQLKANMDRVNEKQQMLSADIRDLVSVNATKENITLQRDVKELTEQLGWLTKALVGLTVLLVVLTVILLVRPLFL